MFLPRRRKTASSALRRRLHAARLRSLTDRRLRCERPSRCERSRGKVITGRSRRQVEHVLQSHTVRTSLFGRRPGTGQHRIATIAPARTTTRGENSGPGTVARTERPPPCSRPFPPAHRATLEGAPSNFRRLVRRPATQTTPGRGRRTVGQTSVERAALLHSARDAATNSPPAVRGRSGEQSCCGFSLR